ncbi:hypothetical protein JKF63_04701 [Porcisia hertigi]|uniref:Uncharacterized protein n=1 Tax=Porcisia hertigi TaxID=2761500 RepID=A0A836LHN4_9TRYP|nr:hypothetical protein JKF63_04701 [Porcisia hertigi]
MNLQPFRLVRPLSRLLHRTMRQMLADPKQTMPLIVTETLITYSLYEQVPHAELLEVLLAGLKRAQSGDVVLTSEDLFLPLRAVRRALSGVQNFPLTTAKLVSLKRDVELGVVRDITRLSTDDLSSEDVGLLWGCATQCSHWDSVEELLRHFPLASTLSLQSASEYRDLLIWVCTPHFVSHTDPRSIGTKGDDASVPTEKSHAAATVRHAEAFIKRILGPEVVWQRCREALVASSKALHASGVSTAGPAASEERDLHAIACVMYAAALELQCGISAGSPLAFSISEAEWVKYVGGADGNAMGSSGDRCVRPSTIGGLSLPVWYRRVVALQQRSIPEVVRASFAAAEANDLLRLYQSVDTESFESFFLSFLPLVIAGAPHMDCRDALRAVHNDVMSTLFEATPSASSVASLNKDRAASTGKRGKWTTKEASMLRTPMSGSAATSCTLPADVALRVMLAEVSVQEKGKPLPEAHLPAMESMLRTVVDHLHRHLHGESRSRAVPRCAATAVKPPPSLWKEWNSHRTSVLAIVLSGIQERMLDSAGQGSSATALMDLVGQGLELLRPLITMDLIEERGTARMLTNLLSCGRAAVLEVGGVSYETDLQSSALQHAQDGFARTDVAAIVQAMEKNLNNGPSTSSFVGDTRARSVLEGLRTAELTLPLRAWS